MAETDNKNKCDDCPHGSSCSPQERKECDQQGAKLHKRLATIKHRLLVLSGKGGVGKSSSAVNLALALAQKGKKVGLLDVDLHGPSIPTMLGLAEAKPEVAEESMLPVNFQGVKVVSIGFLLEKQNDALIWRGPMKANVIRQLLEDVAWGELDYLVVDCPPGTGDEPLTIAQLLGSGTQAVVVTTPQQVALVDVSKSLTFCRQLKMKVAGILENMSGFACPHCGEVVDVFSQGGGEQLAQQEQIPFLGKVPLEPKMTAAADQGQPCLNACADSAAAQAFLQAAERLVQEQE